ncbi:MAG TPA: NAD(P)/FAD-dependent oxidoreductase [Burkholderiaceae bacterium]|nr:NAD(P)/FAD-dependent oxidoreductase [Burkholderiaceae bacterium]
MDHLDVLIVGAGISGIGMARHLRRHRPGDSFALLEARDALGGTWDLFRYPGIRSDSDMHTFGYGFRPWPGEKTIADGPSILRYLHDTVREAGLDGAIRYRHRVTRAAWSSRDARWTVDVERDGVAGTLTCRMLAVCAGYYDPERGHAPRFEGDSSFAGRIVHPQAWPADLDWAGRRVVVIGSGATAVTLVPAMAARAAHVTMLQRSPTWMVSRPSRDALGAALERVLPRRAAHAIARWRSVLFGAWFFRLCRRDPRRAGRGLLKLLRAELPRETIAAHFTPRYDPWTQRLCLVPDGDLFAAIREGRASVVTDHVERFDARGIVLRSGARLDADVIVTATGLELKFLGGIALEVDGARVDPAACLPYRGLMLSDVPNLVQVFGYTNASWTLRADLVARWTCRVLDRMDRLGARWAVPRRRGGETGVDPMVDFSSGYFARALDRFPKQGARAPWRAEQDYLRELPRLRFGRLDDGVLEFGGTTAGRGAPASGLASGSAT